MSGLRLVNDSSGGNTRSRIMVNSGSFDFQDPVYIDSNGFLAPATAGGKIIGVFADADITATSDNQTVLQAKGRYWPINDDMEFEITADQACTNTDCGAYADLAVAAGAYTLNLAAGTSGQFLVLDFDATTTTLVRVTCAERQQDAFTQD